MRRRNDFESEMIKVGSESKFIIRNNGKNILLGVSKEQGSKTDIFIVSAKYGVPVDLSTVMNTFGIGAFAAVIDAVGLKEQKKLIHI